jgi:CBS domain-containing protein
MKTIKVKELMIPLSEYATVSEDATLHEAVSALETAQAQVDQDREKHKAILVLNGARRVVGKLSQWDVIRGLEPNYRNIGDFRETSRFGFSREFIQSMLGKYDLWKKPLEDICKKAAGIKVREIMTAPSEGEYVAEDASLDEAIHLLVMGRHQSLLVTQGEGRIVGILRLSDVFKEVCDNIKACKLE